MRSSRYDESEGRGLGTAKAFYGSMVLMFQYSYPSKNRLSNHEPDISQIAYFMSLISDIFEGILLAYLEEGS